MAEAEPEEENETSLNIKLDYPPLPEEPTGSRDLLCRVAIRLPNNRRIQRNFLHTDPIKVTLPSNFLVSFACFPSLMVSSFQCSSYGHSVLLRLRMGRSGLSTLCSPFLEHQRTWSLQVISLSKKLDWPTQWSTSRGTEPASILRFGVATYFSLGLKMV